MRSYVSRVIEPEEYQSMSTEELYKLIQTSLYVDEGNVNGMFYHKKCAEFLERAMYVCPWCGFTTFESCNDIIHCKTCGRQIRYLPTKELDGIGCQFPFSFVSDWYDWQNEYVNQTDLLTHTQQPLYEETVRLSQVHIYKYKELLKKEAAIRLYGDRITIDDREYPFAETDAVVVLGKNKLNIYAGKDILQLKGNKRFNALKYVNFFHRYKNQMTGDKNGKFLGI